MAQEDKVIFTIGKITNDKFKKAFKGYEEGDTVVVGKSVAENLAAKKLGKIGEVVEESPATKAAKKEKAK